MNLAKDNKGMTLIELVVVMIISVILIGVAGSILVSSTNFLTRTTMSDQDKLATDKIAELIEGEITYSTNVIVSDHLLTQDELGDSTNWRYFLIKKGRLYMNSEDELALSDSYYSNRDFVLTARAYENYRLDLTYDFVNSKKESEYKTSTTILFPNIKVQYEAGNFKSEWFKGTSYTSGVDDEKKVYIYYDRSSIAVNTEKPLPKSGGGTIAAQFSTCMDDTNNRGEYSKIADKNSIKLGDFVYVESGGKTIWYRFVGFDKGGVYDNPAAGRSEYWKEIYVVDSEPKEGQFNNTKNYFQGDVVRFFNNIKVETDFIYIYYNNYKYDSGYENWPNENTPRRWAPVYINPYQNQAELCELTKKNYDKGYMNYYTNHSFIYGTPFAKLYNKDESKSLNPFKGNINFIEYKDGDTEITHVPSSLKVDELTVEYIVKYKDEYYINMTNGDLHPSQDTPGKPNEKGERIWQKLQTQWDSNSAYRQGDIVLWNGYTYVCKSKLLYNGEKPPEIGNEKWMRVYWDSNSSQYLAW